VFLQKNTAHLGEKFSCDVGARRGSLGMRTSQSTFVVRSISLIFALSTALLSLGCQAQDDGTDDQQTGASTSGTSGTSGSTSSGQPTEDPAGGLTLSAKPGSVPAKVSQYSPESGRRFYVATATLANVSSDVPAPLAQTLFTVETADHLVFETAGLTSELTNYCKSDEAVAMGGTVTCSVLFEVAVGSMPLNLVYRDPGVGAGISASSGVARVLSAPLQ
jgi:hypothetical protein